MLNNRVLPHSVVAAQYFCLAALFLALCLTPACTIDTNGKGNDGDKQVDIKSPVGNLHVSEAADIRDAGLSLYPGAKPAPKDDSEERERQPFVRRVLPEGGGGGIHLGRCSRQAHCLLHQGITEVWETSELPRGMDRKRARECVHRPRR